MTSTIDSSPTIFVSTQDYERLIALAMGMERRDPHLADFLICELGRATLVEPGCADIRAVGMNSYVEFRSEPDGRTQCVTLVYPGEENIAEGRISVLTPVGAALIGMQEGESISWVTRQGSPRQLTVLKLRGRTEPSPS